MKKLLMLTSAVMLAACGGGESTSVSGVASKGLLRNSTVQAYLVQVDGSVGSTPLATTRTNRQGEYSLKGLPTNAHLVLQVSGAADGQSTMLDESTGKSETIDASFRLSAIVHTGSSGEFTAHITPFSHMAYARTRALGLQAGQIGASLSRARQHIEQQMGVSMDDKPVFAADGVTPQSESAKRLLAVAQMVQINPCQCPQTSVAGKTQCLIDRLDQDAATKDKDVSPWGRAMSDAPAMLAWMAASKTGGTAAVTETKQAVVGQISTGGSTASELGTVTTNNTDRSVISTGISGSSTLPPIAPSTGSIVNASVIDRSGVINTSTAGGTLTVVQLCPAVAVAK